MMTRLRCEDRSWHISLLAARSGVLSTRWSRRCLRVLRIARHAPWQIMVRKHPVVDGVHKVGIAATRVDGRMLYIGMILAPIHSQPEWYSGVVLGFPGLKEIEVLVLLDQLLESASAR